MSASMLTPEASDLVDGLLGTAAIARRARALIASAAEARTEAGDASLPPPDDELVLALLGVVALARRIDELVESWSPDAPEHPTIASASVSLRELLR